MRSLPTRAAAKALRPVRTNQRVARRRRPVVWGTFGALTPRSANFGRARGTAVDRRYLEAWLAGHAAAIAGDVLEVRDARYTHRFGTHVTRADVLDIDPRNADATILADLGDAGSLPTARYDCAIVTQTLQYVPDPGAALANLVQSLRPGGTLLLTVPSITPIDWPNATIDRWRFTAVAVRDLLHAEPLLEQATVQGFGNLLAATAFLHGIAAEECPAERLDAHDERFTVVVCASAVRSGGHEARRDGVR